MPRTASVILIDLNRLYGDESPLIPIAAISNLAIISKYLLMRKGLVILRFLMHPEGDALCTLMSCPPPRRRGYRQRTRTAREPYRTKILLVLCSFPGTHRQGKSFPTHALSTRTRK